MNHGHLRQSRPHTVEEDSRIAHILLVGFSIDFEFVRETRDCVEVIPILKEDDKARMLLKI